MRDDFQKRAIIRDDGSFTSPLGLGADKKNKNNNAINE
jgi:hypothetical protein